MTQVGEIHWYEGLFLQPHHLQTMQRHLVNLHAQGRKLANSFPYGQIEARLSEDALENLLVQFDRLYVVMPSGIIIDAPHNCELPALDIRSAFEGGSGSVNISLGLPLWYSERGNTIDEFTQDDNRAKRLFRTREVNRFDENSGENEQPMKLRQLNARLLLDGDDHSDLETIPILRIVHATGDQVGLPHRDAKFAPPTLLLNGSVVLRDLSRDLVNQIEASRKELVIQINRGGFKVENMRGVQFEQMLRLRILNHYSARLPELVNAPATTPFDMYLEFRSLQGELAALYPGRDQFEAPAYDHMKPMVPFQAISTSVRGMLRGAVAASYIHVPLTPTGEVHLAQLEAAHLDSANQYYLGIRSGEDPLQLASLVEDPDRFKLMAHSLAQRMIFGVKLALERMPPLELPSEAGLTFFRLHLEESARMWERISEEKEIAARWPGMETADYKLALYMVTPG